MLGVEEFMGGNNEAFKKAYLYGSESCYSYVYSITTCILPKSLKMTIFVIAYKDNYSPSHNSIA